ncbi:MAG: prepilin-type N-terminal cleavage/methylation domain-containing protein [Endomicrobiaceae bacterium]|nr:prepilin-type N-terminal cleavage/methylation domain-containing protein [Endomicrobiaceae bacterium]
MVYKETGLTLIEILVSIVITVMVMVYGLGFFTAAWKFQTEAIDYNIVLNKVQTMVEEMKYKIHEASPVIAATELYYVQTPSSKTVEITRTVGIDATLGGTSYCHQVDVLATWPLKNPDGTELGVNNRHKISMKTHMTVPYGK